MSFVVTNGKIFKEFETIEEAKTFFSENDEFGLEIKERDGFGNLRTLEKEEIGNMDVKKNIADAPKPAAAEPKKEPEQQGYKVESPVSGKLLKYGAIIILAIILVFVFLRIVLPMFKDFSAI